MFIKKSTYLHKFGFSKSPRVIGYLHPKVKPLEPYACNKNLSMRTVDDRKPERLVNVSIVDLI